LQNRPADLFKGKDLWESGLKGISLRTFREGTEGGIVSQLPTPKERGLSRLFLVKKIILSGN